ncbi:hypothetical protein [Haloferax sp. DFSO60]|uniref:hypothetical protein n=1 Tax=Haloferax sp. DFSO60 TaxID=3388652 RepID=UPI00397A438E
MASRTRKRITLFALASGLAVVFFVVTVGLWSAVRPLGDVLVALIVATAICVAGLSGYWQDTPELSVVTTLLVAGGHVLGEIFGRDKRFVSHQCNRGTTYSWLGSRLLSALARTISADSLPTKLRLVSERQ